MMDLCEAPQHLYRLSLHLLKSAHRNERQLISVCFVRLVLRKFVEVKIESRSGGFEKVVLHEFSNLKKKKIYA